MSEKIGGLFESRSPRDKRLHEKAIVANEKAIADAIDFDKEGFAVMREYIKTLDIDLIANLYAHEAEKAGVPRENINTEALKRIIGLPVEQDLFGAYMPDHNQIILSTRYENTKEYIDLKNRAEEIPESVELNLRLLTLHEITHAMASNRHISKDANNQSTHTYFHNGYHQTTRTERHPSRPEKSSKYKAIERFELLNEGVTQRIAEEVFVKYGKEKNEYLSDVYMSARLQHEVMRGSGHAFFGYVVDSICERIASETGSTKDVIWDAVKRGYFQDPAQFLDVYKEPILTVFGPDFLKDLGSLTGNTPPSGIQAFGNKYNLMDYDTYIDRWHASLGIEKFTAHLEQEQKQS